MNMQTTPPPAGHNEPPIYDEAEYQALAEKVRDFADAAGAWADKARVSDEDQAQRLNDFLAGLSGVKKQVEARRKAEKEPHLAAGRTVDAAFKKLTDALAKSEKMAKTILTDWLKEQEAKRQERQRRLAEELAQKRREAEAAAQAAQERNDAMGAVEAEQAIADAQAAQEAAQRPGKAQVESATGAGRRRSLRTHRFPVLNSVNTALLHFRDHPKMRDLLVTLAADEIRHAKDPAHTVPGFTIKEEQRL